MVGNIRPTYSPTTPRVRSMMPAKKIMVIIVDVQPRILVELRNLRITSQIMPMMPTADRTSPALRDMRRGTMEKPAMLDHSAMSFLNE